MNHDARRTNVEKKNAAIERVDGVPSRLLFSSPDVRRVLDANRFVDKDGNVVFRDTGRVVPAADGVDYHVTKNGTIVEIHDAEVRVKREGGDLVSRKAPGSPVFVMDNSVYAISASLVLTKIDVMDGGNACETALKRVSSDSAFHVADHDNIIVCNLYGHRKVVDVSGRVIVLKNDGKVTSSAIRFDPVNSWWLIATRDDRDIVEVHVIDRDANLIYYTDKISYKNSLATWAFHNGFIYMPMAGSIARFDFRAHGVKEFKVPAIDGSTVLVKTGGKIIAIGNKEIHEIG
jgi:hypothetical protein